MTTKTRATYRRAAIALRDACQRLGLPCAYDANGDWLDTDQRPEGYHAIDYVGHYGGCYVYRSNVDGNSAHFEPADPLRRAGFYAGGLGAKRIPLRHTIDALESVAADAPKSRRAAYMSGELTHAEYYGLLVELLGENALRQVLPGHRSAADWAALVAQDRHLNNVPLRSWDVLDSYVRDLLRYVKRDDLLAITGSGGWSVGDSVCVLKVAARRYAESGARA